MKKGTETTHFSPQDHCHHHLNHPESCHGHDGQGLSHCPLFWGMSQKEHNDFLNRNVRETLSFKRGDFVVRQGDSIQSVMLLIQGSIRQEMITMEGNVLDIGILESVIPLASSFIFGGQNNYPADVIALEDVVFLKISKEAWLDEMVNSKQLLTNFLTMNADLTLALTNKLQMISIKSLRKKLATYFLENTTTTNNSFTMNRMRTQLAEYLGVQRQSLARSLKDMEDEGIIELKGRTVNILDRNRLIRE